MTQSKSFVCNPGVWAKFFVLQDKVFAIIVYICYKIKQNANFFTDLMKNLMKTKYFVIKCQF